MSMHHARIGNTVYEFRCVAEVAEALELHRHFIGHQHQFERAMVILHIPFAPRIEVSKPVYRVDLTKEAAPFCVIANNMYEAADWVRDHVVERGFFVTNING